MADINSPYYPYERVQDYASVPRLELLLDKLVKYILDLPEPGYTPPDNNEYPRCRIAKLLYYDMENPLSQPLPTPRQKLALVFDPKRPDRPPDGEKQYRVLPMAYPMEAEYVGRTNIKIYMSWAKATSPFRIDQAVTFEILANNAYEGNVEQCSLSRSFDIATDLIKALNGVNIDGVGTFYFDRRQHSDCGITPIFDKAQNVGYQVTLGVSFIGGEAVGETY